MSRATAMRRAGRYTLAGGSIGLISGALTAYYRHPAVGQVLMISGAVLLVLGAILLANFNPPTGGSDV